MSRVVNWASGLSGVSGQPWDGVEYFCTWRLGGLSQAPWDSLNLGLHVDDDPAAVAANRARVQALLPTAPVWLDQVHGTAVWDAGRGIAANLAVAAMSPVALASPAVSSGSGVPCADAAITSVRQQPLAIMTADCLPVVLADLDGEILGVAHAGWRGLAAGVLENTLSALRCQAPGSRGWRAWLGPAIGPAVFEVGAEVRQVFVGQRADLADCFVPSGEDGHWLADLPELARRRLIAAGVERVELSGECTYRQADRYFSYRRQRRTGRQATLAWLV